MAEQALRGIIVVLCIWWVIVSHLHILVYIDCCTDIDPEGFGRDGQFEHALWR